MSGSIEQRGINPRALHDILAHAERRRSSGGEAVELRVCMFEIYNDRVRDLMGGGHEPADNGAAGGRGHGGRGDGGGGGEDGGVVSAAVQSGAASATQPAQRLDLALAAFDEWAALPPASSPRAKGGEVARGMDDGGLPSRLFSAAVHTVDDIMTVIAIGNSLRARASTQLNTLSSRSHTVLVLRAQCTNTLTGAQTVGRMHLIDLAGSEDMDRSGARAQGGVLEEEARHINASLAALGRVMRDHAARVPPDQIDYGQSALTRMLKSSLMAQTKMVMLVHANPAPHLAAETAETLRFGASVRAIELGKATARAPVATRNAATS